MFGAIVSGVGCLRGLQTKDGPSAVGDPATRAVVAGILSSSRYWKNPRFPLQANSPRAA